MCATQTLKIVFLVGLVAARCSAQETSEFDKLPVWPANGKLTEKLQDRYVFRDVSSFEVVIAVPTDPGNPQGPRTIYRYRPQNQVDPRITVEISRAIDGRVQYRYMLANAAGARLPIRAWSLVLAGPESDVELDHPKWGKIRLKGTSLEQAAHPGAPAGDTAYWSRRDAPGLEIAPGQSAGDFVLKSSYLPGFTTAYVQGGQPLSTRGELPFEVAEQLIPLMRLKEDTRIVLTFGPRFAPDTDKRTIAADYQRGLQQLAKRGLLSDKTSFHEEATGILAACANPSPNPCPVVKLAERFVRASSPLEKEVGSALLMALK